MLRSTNGTMPDVSSCADKFSLLAITSPQTSLTQTAFRTRGGVYRGAPVLGCSKVSTPSVLQIIYQKISHAPAEDAAAYAPFRAKGFNEFDSANRRSLPCRPGKRHRKSRCPRRSVGFL